LFGTNNVQSLALEVNSKLIPKVPQQLNWQAGHFAYTQPFMQLIQNSCGVLEQSQIPVTLEDFKGKSRVISYADTTHIRFTAGGYGIFTFNLNPDSDTCYAHKSERCGGVIKCVANFSQKSDAPLLFLFILETERVIEIDRDCNVEVI
jgi:hypothetical protein